MHYLLGIILLLPTLVWGETAVLYTLPGGERLSEAPDGDFSSLVNTLYLVAIGAGCALAVVMLLLEGMRYSTSTLPGVKSEVKGRIPLIITGLVLLIGASLFLSIINPRLVNYSPLSTETIEQTDQTQPWIPPVTTTSEDRTPPSSPTQDPNQTGPQ